MFSHIHIIEWIFITPNLIRKWATYIPDIFYYLFLSLHTKAQWNDCEKIQENRCRIFEFLPWRISVFSLGCRDCQTSEMTWQISIVITRDKLNIQILAFTLFYKLYMYIYIFSRVFSPYLRIWLLLTKINCSVILSTLLFCLFRCLQLGYPRQQGDPVPVGLVELNLP